MKKQQNAEHEGAQKLRNHVIRIKVLAKPEQKGSWKTMQLKDGRSITVPANSKYKNFHKAIQRTIAKLGVAPCKPIESAVLLNLRFFIRRRKTVKREYPTTAPDIDKFCRTVLDALTGIIYKDDAQVVSLDATKEYAPNGLEGVEITVIEQSNKQKELF